MKYTFELYITTDTIVSETWNKLYRSLASYLGVLPKFEIIFKCEDNVVRFFISSDKDLSSLSNNIEGFIIRQADKDDLKFPKASTRERFFQFVTGGNILDLKEKTAVKKGKSLEIATFKIRALNIEKSIVRCNFYLKNSGGSWSVASKLIYFFPSKLFAIDLASNTRYMKKTIPKYLDIEKSLHILSSDNLSAIFQVDTFPYFDKDYYLNITSYDFDKHSLIVGASGSGKSKLISLIVDRISKTALKMNYRIVIIDPHAALQEDFEHIPDGRVISFGKQDSTDLFPGAGTDLAAGTELTSTLFKSLLADQFNPRMERLLRFSLFVLMTAQAMTLENLKRYLTDSDYREQILSHVRGYVPENIVKFFGADFNEVRSQYYSETILPIVSMVDEMQLQPSLVGESEISLAKTVQENFLTVFSLNKVSMGEKVVKTIAGLLIQQIFLLAQARIFGQHVILIIDEVSVVQNPTIAQILAEARKFNLTVILTQQYFGQVDKDLRDAIFANVYNYYTFKVSEEDARTLEGNLNIALPEDIVKNEKEKGIKESDLKVKIMTELHPRECLVRLMSRGQILPCVKAKTLDAPKTTAKKQENSAQLQTVLPDKFIEGANVAKEPIKFSEEFVQQLVETTASNPSQSNPEQTEQQDFRTSRVFSVNDLLKQRSTSKEQTSE